MSSSEIPLAALGGWPLILLLIALVVVFVVALCRISALGDLEIYYLSDVDVVDQVAEHEGRFLGTWSFFDWEIDAPELVDG